MKLVADTITDAQIRALRESILGPSIFEMPPLTSDDHAALRWTSIALDTFVGEEEDPEPRRLRAYEARARCAEILNARGGQ